MDFLFKVIPLFTMNQVLPYSLLSTFQWPLNEALNVLWTLVYLGQSDVIIY